MGVRIRSPYRRHGFEFISDTFILGTFIPEIGEQFLIKRARYRFYRHCKEITPDKQVLFGTGHEVINDDRAVLEAIIKCLKDRFLADKGIFPQ